jgi:hypothetical protein
MVPAVGNAKHSVISTVVFPTLRLLMATRIIMSHDGVIIDGVWIGNWIY